MIDFYSVLEYISLRLNEDIPLTHIVFFVQANLFISKDLSNPS